MRALQSTREHRQQRSGCRKPPLAILKRDGLRGIHTRESISEKLDFPVLAS